MITRSGSQLPPLLIEWSATRVRVFDPVTRESTLGSSITESMTERQAGREIIVAVGQQSTFIRTVQVPGAAKDDLEKMVAFKVAPMLPLSAGEYVSGFRLGRESVGDGRVAVVGAMRTGSLRRIHQEATDNGLKVRAVLPLAFGSWMAARAKSLNDCAVVETRPESIHIDVIAKGELRYSRTVPMSDPSQTVEEEVAKTLAIAEVPPTTVLSMASPEVIADYLDTREALEHLGDAGAIDKYLFTLELPEKARARAIRAQNRVASRAIVTALVALGFGVFVFLTRYNADAKIAAENARHDGQITRARAGQKAEEKRLAETAVAKAALNQAFTPAQTYSDVLISVGASSVKDCWFTGVTLERGKDLVLNGQALSSEAVASYVKSLAASPRFRNVKLVYANKGLIGDKPVVQFAISGHVVGNLPLEEAALQPVTDATKPGGKR